MQLWLAKVSTQRYFKLVATLQILLLPDPHPLDERLGKDFFRLAPTQPGVYLMRDQADRVLYVGKAKNLRRRLNSYRLANPDRMPRRHLRLVRQVARIEFQLCVDESAALVQEAKLLRELKPRFNRAGVWPGKIKYLAWRCAENSLELAVADAPLPDWQHVGPLNSSAHFLHATLARLLWLAAQPAQPVHGLPAGWTEPRLPGPIAISGSRTPRELAEMLESFLRQIDDKLLLWLDLQFAERVHPFEKLFIEAELDALKQFPLANLAKTDV